MYRRVGSERSELEDREREGDGERRESERSIIHNDVIGQSLSQ